MRQRTGTAKSAPTPKGAPSPTAAPASAPGPRSSRGELPKYEAIEELARNVPGVPSRAVAAYIRFLIVATELGTALEHHLARYGFSRARFTVLMCLYNGSSGQGGQRAGGELAQAMGVPPATMTGLIAGLEAQGLVERVKVEGDRRVVAVRLTPTGKKRIRDVLPDHYRRLGAIAGSLDEKEVDFLISVLDKLRDGIGGLEAP